jgi:LDH2 family malate/lactate/ureidoglycolate dehydrogenase
MMSDEQRRVSAAELQVFIQRALEKVGLPSADARTCAELMTRADVNGSDGHGVFRLPQYVRRIKGGAVNVRPKVRIVAESAAMAVVDGDNGMGHVVMRFAAETAIRKAKTARRLAGVRGAPPDPASLYGYAAGA